MKKAGFIALLLTLLMLAALCGCSSGNNTAEPAVSETSAAQDEPKAFSLDSLPTFEVTSESLKDGEWDDEISNTANGSNLSPELSWESVDGASEYAVYFVDESIGGYLHMKKTGVEGTSLALGEVEYTSSGDDYVGPYPPDGTHDYVIYVFALREGLEKYPGNVDLPGRQTAQNLATDIDAGTQDGGNIIAYGMLKGTYTAK